VKIAVATIDGVSLSQHFGQSKGFVVFEVEGTTVQGQELRSNDDTPHNQGICGHAGESPRETHGHVGLLDLLSDCTVLLCGGMGAGAAQSLMAQGIKPVILPGSCSARDAVVSYLSGNAAAAPAGFCNCQH
jgi:predicted Fe-Mo cluster-binding NifX family protein